MSKKRISKDKPNGVKNPVGSSNSKNVGDINESLTPEVSKKAQIIFKSMINDRRDKLFKKYGVDAERVAYGKAINQAKKEARESIDENTTSIDLKEIVKKIIERLKS